MKLQAPPQLSLRLLRLWTRFLWQRQQRITHPILTTFLNGEMQLKALDQSASCASKFLLIFQIIYRLLVEIETEQFGKRIHTSSQRVRSLLTHCYDFPIFLHQLVPWLLFFLFLPLIYKCSHSFYFYLMTHFSHLWVMSLLIFLTLTHLLDAYSSF